MRVTINIKHVLPAETNKKKHILGKKRKKKNEEKRNEKHGSGVTLKLAIPNSLSTETPKLNFHEGKSSFRQWGLLGDFFHFQRPKNKKHENIKKNGKNDKAKKQKNQKENEKRTKDKMKQKRKTKNKKK